MNTLHGIRKLALSAALGLGALIASATPAVGDRAGDASSFADLGQITVLARRDAPVADLGSLIVSAPRLTDASFADLGTLTVTASRIADARVADLGGLTVTAKRRAPVTVATIQASGRFWK